LDERADFYSATIHYMNARLARAEWSARHLASQAGLQATATTRGSRRVAWLCTASQDYTPAMCGSRACRPARASQAGSPATATALGSWLVAACARRPAYDHSPRLAGAM